MTLRTLPSVLTSALVLLAVTGMNAAHADCEICAKSVTLSDDLARCYLDKVSDVVAQSARLGLPVALFDLTDCPTETTRKGLSLPEPRRADDAQASLQIDARFVLDAELAHCLEDRIRSDLMTIADIRHYVFAQDCPDE